MSQAPAPEPGGRAAADAGSGTADGTVDVAADVAADVASAGERAGEPRLQIIDVLRGFALMGILQVNIQSFTWGAGEALGYLDQPPGPAESVLYFLQSAFFAGKFYPIFAFLFGVGMALQRHRLRRRNPEDPRAANRAYRRRLIVLLGLGIAHGVLLYSGDVLSAYAICAMGFTLVAPERLRSFVPFLGWSWVVAVLSLLAPLLAVAALDIDEPPGLIPESARVAHEWYIGSGFVAQIGQRWFDELWQQLNSIVTFWPQVIALFGLGSLAGRLGWLHHPERHPLVWRRAWQLGLGAGLPCALVGAALALVRARNAPGAEGQWDSVVLGASSLLACVYVAALVAGCRRAWTRTIYRWLADTGRLSLSNYVLQSLLMGALLSGWGLGLGAQATRAQLAALGLAIFAGQLLLSRWTLARFRQGPLEALWRRWTYGRSAVPGGSGS